MKSLFKKQWLTLLLCVIFFVLSISSFIKGEAFFGTCWMFLCVYFGIVIYTFYGADNMLELAQELIKVTDGLQEYVTETEDKLNELNNLIKKTEDEKES